MQSINTLSTRAFVSSKTFIESRTNSEFGGVTAEYGTLALVAIALVLAITGIVTGGIMDSVFKDLLQGVLKKATSLATKI